jgi:hypothetical protein
MPCNYTVLQDGRMIVERWVGPLDYEALVEHKRRQRLDAAIKFPASVLSDCRRASVEISPEAVDRLSAEENDHQGEAVRRYAFLVNPELYERVQRFGQGVGDVGKSVLIFNRLEAACHWLALDAKEIEAVLAKLDA